MTQTLNAITQKNANLHCMAKVRVELEGNELDKPIAGKSTWKIQLPKEFICVEKDGQKMKNPHLYHTKDGIKPRYKITVKQKYRL